MQRLGTLFVASCFFYAFFIPPYLIVLFFIIALDFLAAQKIEETSKQGLKKIFLSLSLISNISILVYFKYANFFLANLTALGNALGVHNQFVLINVILPIGLSFHTFQSMSYVLEVYYGRFKASRSWLVYSVYVLYFPQLVAGPIERPQNVIPQLERFQAFDYERSVRGLYLIAQGLFKKVCIADTLALLANRIFEHPLHYGPAATLAGTLAFCFQIYCDFSGYSDIARGTSELFGITLMKNFNLPYFATSISDFWRRWHISLSTWFRDYLYFPLGGNRRGMLRTSLNLMLVFGVSGLWHGANWTFLTWGFLHGTSMILGVLMLDRLQSLTLPTWVSRAFVFGLVWLTWIFFRANSVTEAFDVLRAIQRPFLLGINSIPLFLPLECCLFILALFFFEAKGEDSLWLKLRNIKTTQRWAIYATLLWVYLFTAQISGQQFIYFQF